MSIAHARLPEYSIGALYSTPAQPTPAPRQPGNREAYLDLADDARPSVKRPARAARSARSSSLRYTKEVRAAGVTLIVIASVLVVAVLLGIALFTVTVPTTFSCRAFIDASAEARLEYPNARLLSYVSHEGSRDLTGMSNPQVPGFTKYWEISSDDQEAFRWFDEQLQALGWKPLEVRASDQFRRAGSTERGSGALDGLPRPAEVISLVHMEGSQIDITVSGTSPRAVLRFIYLIATPAEFPACR